MFFYSFEVGCNVLQFENGEQYVEFAGVTYDDVEDFFEAENKKI